MTISIIIPTYNEADNIAPLIQYLITNSANSVVDIIVCDGGSNDKTVEVAELAGAKTVVSPKKGRAAQMNYGASIAKGGIYYFIHADCFPPLTFVKDIKQAVESCFHLGRYKTEFNSNRNILKINEWFTRFDLFICMGGDQTLFVEKKHFIKCNGFDEKMKIMEDYEFCERARKTGKYKILNGKVLVSDRKYYNNNWLRVQLANMKIIRMYKKGVQQEELLKKYRNVLSYRKNSFE